MVRTRKEQLALRADGLQLEEHRRFQERFWKAERWAWLGYGLIVLAALAGLTGAGGPLAHGHAGLGDGGIDYPRIARWEGTDALSVTFAPGGAERSLTLSAGFAEGFQVQDIQPVPEHSKARPEGQRLRFTLPAGAPATVMLHVRPTTPGLARFRATLDGGPAATLTTLVLP